MRIAKTEDVVESSDPVTVHLPSPSYWPLVLALGMPLVGYGLIFNLWWAVPGVILIVAGIYGWVMEPATDPDAGHGHDDHHGEPDEPDSAEIAAPESVESELVSASAGSTAATAEEGDSK